MLDAQAAAASAREEIIVEFIRNEDYKYVRVLGELCLSSHNHASCMPCFGPTLASLPSML